MNPSDVSITSDFDYLKIAQDNTILITTTTPSDSDFAFPTDPFEAFLGEQGVVPITHNLGSIPLVRAFIQSTSGLWYSSYASIGLTPIDPNLLSLVSTTTLKICVNANSHQSNVPVFYRIYKPGTTALDSDDRIDKIFMKSDPSAPTTVTIGAASDSSDPVQSLVPIAHHQGEDILWTLQFSDGSGWYNDGSYVYGLPDTSSGPPGGPYANYYYSRAYGEGDSNDFYIRFEHNYPTSVTLYARWSLDYRT